MSKKPRQKVVLITGASTGIGRATAKLLASKGYQVYGGVRSPERVEPLPGVELVRVDVRDDASIAAGVEAVLRNAGQIDVLVNNAGYNLVGAVEETSIEQAQALFDTNVFGVLRMMRAVLPAMRRERSGLIINVSSVLGFLPAPFMGLYASSKHAVEGLSESLDHETTPALSPPIQMLSPSTKPTMHVMRSPALQSAGTHRGSRAPPFQCDRCATSRRCTRSAAPFRGDGGAE